MFEQITSSMPDATILTSGGPGYFGVWVTTGRLCLYVRIYLRCDLRMPCSWLAKYTERVFHCNLELAYHRFKTYRYHFFLFPQSTQHGTSYAAADILH